MASCAGFCLRVSEMSIILLVMAGAAAATAQDLKRDCSRFFSGKPPKWGNEDGRAERAAAIAHIKECLDAFEMDVEAVHVDASKPKTADAAASEPKTPSASEPTTEATPRPSTKLEYPRLAGEAGAKESPDLRALRQRQAAALLKKWIGALTKGDDGRGKGKVEDVSDPEKTLEEAKDQLEETRRTLDTALELLGLRQWFTAEIVPGVVYGDSPDGSSQSELAFVHLQSRHVSFSYDEDRNLDFSLGGGFGIQPTLTLLQLRPIAASGETLQPPTTQYKDAFVWEARPQAQLHMVRGQVELALFGRAGQARLLNVAELRDGPTGDELVSLFNRDEGRSTWFFGAGLGMRLVQNGLSVLHERKDADVPLDVMFSYNYDLRFKQTSSPSLLFDRPEHRLGVKLSFNVPIKSDGGDPARKLKPGTVSIGFCVEHEFALYDNGVPAATKLSVRGDTNLFKLLKRGN